jgi:type IV pilus biogenesis protein CpaD/CtpE
MFEFVTPHQFWAVLLLALLLAASVCATRYTVHPGALNTTDSATYDALLIAETTIDQARLDYKAGQLPASGTDALDALIQTYDVARVSWLTYRGAIATNVPPQTYLDTLNKNLSDLTNAIRQLKEAK